MSQSSPRVVFDCVIFVQALISGRGPAAACIEQVKLGGASLFISPAVLAELRDVPLRPSLTERYKHLTPDLVEAFVADIEQRAVRIESPPSVFKLPRDPKDEPYIDLAVAADASFLVTWNAKHLTYLMEGNTPEGREFRERFPRLEILSPTGFLHKLRQLDEDSGVDS